MPADRLLSRRSPTDNPTAAPATRREYARRRLHTAAGLQELRQWRRTGGVLAVYTVALGAALRTGAIATSADTLHAAWVDLTDTRTITTAVVKAAFTVAVAFTLPLAMSAARVVVRLRPWRPHSGQSVMWSTPPQRLRTNWPAWRAAAQAHMLNETPTPTAPGTAPPTQPRPEPEHPVRPVQAPPEPTLHLIEPQPEPAHTHQPKPATAHQSELAPEPTDTHQPEPEPATAQPEPQPAQPEPATAEDARLLDAMAQIGIADLWTDDLADGEPENPAASADGPPATAVEPEDPPAGKNGPLSSQPNSLVFWLFGPNKVSPERESMLALLVANNRRLHLKDGARILDVQPTTLRMRLTRAAQDGWTKHTGINHWTLSDQVTTDLEMLITAVSDSDEHIAAQIAEGVGPPLPALRAEWIDTRAGGPTPREELRAAADDVLARAAELWPTNKTFTDAVDRLYEDD